MVQLSNSPQEAAVLEAEARKSFSFGVWLKDRLGNPVDVTGTSMTFTAGKLNRDGTSTILLSKVAAIQNPLLGYSVVQAQAADLDAKTGVYQFTLTLRMNGYSVVLLKGDFKLLENTEWASVDETFTAVNPSQGLEVKLRDKLNVHVTLSNSLAPNLSTPVDGTDAGVAGFIGDVTSLTRVALDTLYVSHVELSDQLVIERDWTSGQLALTLDAANDYADAGLALKANTTYVNSQIATRLATSLLSTKGDLLVRSTAPTRLPVGANNSVLQADSAQATGLKWTTRETLTLRGTAAARDAYYGVPATDAAKSALANTVPYWYNTGKGYTEIYYATTGTAGLTATGLLAGYPTGWYPVAGSLLTATRIKNNGFQAVTGGVMAFPTLLPTFLVNRGGFTAPGVSDMAPPIGGYFTVVSGMYWSGGGAMIYRNNMLRMAGNEIGAIRGPNTGADGQTILTVPGVPIPAGQAIEAASVTAANDNIYGDGVLRRTFVAMSYDGPPLAA